MKKSAWKFYWTLARTRSSDMNTEMASRVMDKDAMLARITYLNRDCQDRLIARHEMLQIAIAMPLMKNIIL